MNPDVNDALTDENRTNPKGALFLKGFDTAWVSVNGLSAN